MITSPSSPLKLASWNLKNTEIDAIREGDKVSFHITGNDVNITELALQSMHGWIRPEDIDWESDLTTFYGLFQPIILGQVGMVLSLIDRKIAVGRSRNNLIRMVISIENGRPHLRIQSEKTIYSIATSNIEIAREASRLREAFLPINGKLTWNAIKKVRRIAEYGIVCFDLDKKMVKFEVTPIFCSRSEFLIFVKGLSGNTINIKVTSDTSIGKIKQRIQKKNGIPTDQQNLRFAGYPLNENDRILKDYNIVRESTLHLGLHLRGGGTQSTSFANLKIENQINISFGDSAPKWKIIAPGLNLVGTCITFGCPAKDKRVWIRKRFGQFNINKLANEFRDRDIPKESRECICPVCKEPVSNVENCGFYKCLFSICGQTSTDKIERSNEEAPDDKCLSFLRKPTDSDSLSQYRYLIITTTPKPEPACIIH